QHRLHIDKPKCRTKGTPYPATHACSATASAPLVAVVVVGRLTLAGLLGRLGRLLLRLPSFPLSLLVGRLALVLLALLLVAVLGRRRLGLHNLHLGLLHHLLRCRSR